MLAAYSPERDFTPLLIDENGDANDYHVALMMRVKDGDGESYEILVRIFQEKVISTIAKMLGCPTEAEDLAQKVFLQVWKSASWYQPQARFQTWLFAIAKNLVLNEVRRRKRKPFVSLDEREDEFQGIETASGTMSPDVSALLIELEEVINQAIEELPEMQRFALMVRHSEEMPYEEIAKRLNTTPSCVKGLLFRARSQLKLRMEDYFEG